MSDCKLILSSLPHTWLLDLDGTIVKHNGYLSDGHDTLLEGAIEFLNEIRSEDRIIFLTSREEKYREETVRFLRENNIRFDQIIFGVPYGERIIVNDRMPSGLPMSCAVNKNRDSSEFPVIIL